MSSLALSRNSIKYAGRAPSASTATGFNEVHKQQQSLLATNACDLAF